MMQSYLEYEKAVLDEIEKEIRLNHPVHTMYKLVRFISYSAGKGRKRNRPKEIVLVKVKRGGACISWNKFPFDEAGALLDGNNNLSTGEIMYALLDGNSQPENEWS